MKALLLATVSVLVAVPAYAQTSSSGTGPTSGESTATVDPTAGTDTTSAPASAAPATPTASSGTTGLQEIVVTAQRRSENLQRAAIAITAVSGTALRDAGVTRPQELTSVVPALQVATSAGPYALFYVRGVGNFNGNALSDSALAFNFNGVYIGRPSGTTGFFYDLQRIEVLKGPQGTLYGRNATGGAINVLPQLPELGTFSGYVNGEYGNYNAARVDGAVNLPVGDKAAVRAAGIYVRHDGYLNDGTDDQKDYGGRLSLLLAPTDNLKITTTADYFHQGGRGAGAIVVAQGATNRYGLGSPEAGSYFAGQPNAIAGRNFDPIPNDAYQRNRNWGISSTVEWKTPAGTITLIPAYRKTDLDYRSFAPGFTVTELNHDSQFSFEGRLASNEGHKLGYLVGLFYYDETTHVPLYAPNNQYQISVQDFSTRTRSMATFGRLSYAITDTLKATVGGRYTTEDKSFEGTLLSFNKVCLAALTPPFAGSCPAAQRYPVDQLTNPGLIFPPGSINAIPQFDPSTGILQTGTQINNNNRASFDKITWRAGVDWQATPRNLVYASFETGFKSGGFFFSNDNGTFKPETIKAYTVGSKNRFFDNRLQVNVEGFYWKYRNQQVSHLGQDSTGTVIFPTDNAGRATFKGVEVDGQYLLTKTTLFTADVQYLNAKYDSFVYYTPSGNGPPFTACLVPGAPTVQGFKVDCSGRRPPNAPAWTLNLGAQQTIPLGAGKVVLGARAHYQTRALTGLEFFASEYQKGYWTGDATVTYSAPGDRFSITGFVNNVTNKTILSGTYPPPLSTFITGNLRPPRTYGIRGGFKF